MTRHELARLREAHEALTFAGAEMQGKLENPLKFQWGTGGADQPPAAIRDLISEARQEHEDTMTDKPVLRDTTRLTVGSTLAAFRAVIQDCGAWTDQRQKAYDDAQEDLRCSSNALFAAAEREKQLCHALVTLRNEVGGTLSFAGTLREAIGNTNYACLENAHGIANAALASEQQEEKP